MAASRIGWWTSPKVRRRYHTGGGLWPTASLHPRPTYSTIFAKRLLRSTVLGAAVITAIALGVRPVARSGSSVGFGTVAVGNRAGITCCLPEIFFYAIAATATAVLNVSDSYAPAACGSVVNNLIVLAISVVLTAVRRPVTLPPSTMTTAQVLVLRIGTTIGIVGQAAWTVAALRRTEFRWSWRVRLAPYT
ncbi:lipid II flippase MurJ [Rhodococcus sp. NPDC055024]